jgi:hypothetical protein
MRYACLLLLLLFLFGCKKEPPAPLTVNNNAQLKVTVKKIYTTTPTVKDSALNNVLVSIYQYADDRTNNVNAEHKGYTDTAGVVLFTSLKVNYYYIAVSYGQKTIYDQVSTPDNALSFDEIDF